MRVKYFLIVAITAASILFVMANYKQAHAYNIVSIVGADQIVTTSVDDASDSAKIEPAGG